MLPGGLDATTIIGGQEVPNEGWFTRDVVLTEGENVIEILAIDPVGNEQLKVVNIFRDTVKPEFTVTLPESDYLLTNSPDIRFEGSVSGSQLAALTDRVRLAQGQPQLYGTQLGAEMGQQIALAPIEDEQNVDERRAELGLSTLAVYLVQVCEETGVCVER